MQFLREISVENAIIPTMKLHLKKLFAIASVGLVTLAFCHQTQGVPISGSIAFLGSGSASQSGGTSTINFNNPFSTIGETGSYSGVPIFTPVTFQNFSFTGSGLSAVLTASVLPVWTFTFGGNTYSFDLTSLISGTVTAGGLDLQGTGTAHITGFDNTAGTFALQGTGNNFSFAFITASTSAVAVPENGSAVVFLGISLVVLAALSRKFRIAA